MCKLVNIHNADVYVYTCSNDRYIYICMYVYMYVYIYIHMIYIHIHAGIHTCIRACMHAKVRKHAHPPFLAMAT